MRAFESAFESVCVFYLCLRACTNEMHTFLSTCFSKDLEQILKYPEDKARLDGTGHYRRPRPEDQGQQAWKLLSGRGRREVDDGHTEALSHVNVSEVCFWCSLSIIVYERGPLPVDNNALCLLRCCQGRQLERSSVPQFTHMYQALPRSIYHYKISRKQIFFPLLTARKPASDDSENKYIFLLKKKIFCFIWLLCNYCTKLCCCWWWCDRWLCDRLLKYRRHHPLLYLFSTQTTKDLVD